MPTGDTYKASLFTHTSQRQVINTFYYKAGVTVTTEPFEEAQALAEAWVSGQLTFWRLALSQEVSFGCLKIEKVVGSEIPFWIEFFDNIVGLRAVDPIAANLVGIIIRRGTVMEGSRRSLLSITGVSEADTTGSFMETAFFNGAFTNLANVLNNTILSSPSFQSADWLPVIPHTGYVYARDVAVNVDPSTKTVSLTDGTNWSTRGFITGPSFRILAPNKNKGTYSATVVPLSADITLTDNFLELAGAQTLSAQQVVTPVVYNTLGSAVGNIALRQLNRRRSSHTGIVA